MSENYTNYLNLESEILKQDAREYRNLSHKTVYQVKRAKFLSQAEKLESRVREYREELKEENKSTLSFELFFRYALGMVKREKIRIL